MLRKIFSAALFVIICLVFFSFKNEHTFNLKIKFSHFAGEKELVLEKGNYINKSGQSFTVTKLQYYISNIKLQSNDGTTYFNKNGYYLIDAANDSSCTISLNNVPEKKYNSLTFIVGIDSLKSTEENIQEGALDPMNGMFWTWNTGYIFFKLEGKSPNSSAPNNELTYHIGGYKKPVNCIRTIKLDLLSQTTEIIIQTDVSKFLESVDFSKLPSATTHLHAEEMAGKYQQAFSLKK